MWVILLSHPSWGTSFSCFTSYLHKTVQPLLLLLLVSWVFSHKHLNLKMTKPFCLLASGKSFDIKKTCGRDRPDRTWTPRLRLHYCQLALRLFQAQAVEKTWCVSLLRRFHNIIPLHKGWIYADQSKVWAQVGNKPSPLTYSHEYFSLPFPLRFREFKMKEGRVNSEILTEKNFPDRKSFLKEC